MPRDVAALGMAIAGFIVAGPMELFLPEAATDRFGGTVWLLLLAFYGLCLTLIVLLMRPRLVIYNANPEQLRSILAEVVAQLDDEARWAGDSLVLPKLGVQLHVELFGAMRNVQLVVGRPQTEFCRLETAGDCPGSSAPRHQSLTQPSRFRHDGPGPAADRHHDLPHD